MAIEDNYELTQKAKENSLIQEKIIWANYGMHTVYNNE